MSRCPTLLSSRIKLRQRHVTEWYALINNQQAVWTLFQNETDNKLSALGATGTDPFYLKRERGVRLSALLAKQRKDRLSMQQRHQQEHDHLAQVYSDRNLNKDPT